LAPSWSWIVALPHGPVALGRAAVLLHLTRGALDDDLGRFLVVLIAALPGRLVHASRAGSAAGRLGGGLERRGRRGRALPLRRLLVRLRRAFAAVLGRILADLFRLRAAADDRERREGSRHDGEGEQRRAREDRGPHGADASTCAASGPFVVGVHAPAEFGYHAAATSRNARLVPSVSTGNAQAIHLKSCWCTYGPNHRCARLN